MPIWVNLQTFQIPAEKYSWWEGPDTPNALRSAISRENTTYSSDTFTA